MSVVAVFPQLLGNGGVQRLGRHMAAALKYAAGTRGMSVRVLSLADPKGVSTIQVGDDAVELVGHGGSKLTLAMSYRRAAGDAACAWFGHPFTAILGLTAKLPYLVHAHGIEVWAPMSMLRRKAIGRARLVSASSSFSARETVRHQGVDEARIEVLYPALDPAIAVVSEIGQREPIILAVTRMAEGDRGKNLDQAIAAFAKISPAHPEWRFCIVGDGADRERLHSIAVRTNAPVEFLGRVDDDVLRGLYRRASLFCLPSTKEGFGIVFLEAMANGLPVLSVRATAVPEVVVHGETGLLSSIDDVDALSVNMAHLMENEDTRRVMAEKSLAQARRFLMPTFRARVDGLLSRLLEEAR